LNPRDPRHASRLKHLITGKRLLIEPKGVDAFEIDSKCQLMFTTNNRHVVQASAAERRYFCLHVRNGNLQDRPYFAAMLAEMQAGGYAAFFADMLARPIDDVNFGAPPATALLSTQIVESMTGLERWWCATLASGRLPFARDPQAEDVDVEWPVGVPWTAPKALVQSSANDYARGYDGPPTPEAIGKFLGANVPGLTKTRRQIGLNREHVYVFPPLDACREAFVAARPGLLLEHVTDAIPEARAIPAPAARSGAGRESGNVVPLRPAITA
jgi:Family of unknown function (DUF5906)